MDYQVLDHRAWTPDDYDVFIPYQIHMSKTKLEAFVPKTLPTDFKTALERCMQLFMAPSTYVDRDLVKNGMVSFNLIDQDVNLPMIFSAPSLEKLMKEFHEVDHYCCFDHPLSLEVVVEDEDGFHDTVRVCQPHSFAYRKKGGYGTLDGRKVIFHKNLPVAERYWAYEIARKASVKLQILLSRGSSHSAASIVIGNVLHERYNCCLGYNPGKPVILSEGNSRDGSSFEFDVAKSGSRKRGKRSGVWRKHAVPGFCHLKLALTGDDKRKLAALGEAPTVLSVFHKAQEFPINPYAKITFNSFDATTNKPMGAHVVSSRKRSKPYVTLILAALLAPKVRVAASEEDFKDECI